MFNIFRSNRVERLVDVLTTIVGSPIGPPLMPEWVAVPSYQVGAWLASAVSEKLGIWANVNTPFPRALIEQLLSLGLGYDGNTPQTLNRELIGWSTIGILDDLLKTPEFEPLENYLQGDEQGLKRYLLAEHIATVFDDYSLYRPEMILEWEKGKQTERAGWQPILWNAAIQRSNATHIPALARKLIEALHSGQYPKDRLPKRISIFGVPSLPPLHMEILSALSESMEINLLLVSPSKEYWGHIRSKRASSKNQGSNNELYFEEGHPLLASLGRVGRDFVQVIESSCNYNEPSGDLYEQPNGPVTMLGVLQNDLLNLTKPQGAYVASDGDRSVSIHSCYGPVREVEVLKDQLLDLMNVGQQSVSPQDIVVMVPDLETYAPIIEGVFDSGVDQSDRTRQNEPQIPFEIVGRSVRGRFAVIDSLLAILEMIDGRMSAGEVLDLLCMDPISERYSMSVADVELVTQWVDQAGIRWGIDAKHRAAWDQPALDQNTWRFGLNRLLLGSAMPTDGQKLFNGVLPYDEIEGQQSDILGAMADFCANLFDFAQRFEKPQKVSGWTNLLFELMDKMLSCTDDNLHQHQIIRDTLMQLDETVSKVCPDEMVSFGVIRHIIHNELEQNAQSGGLALGAVTFTTLAALKGVPFKVVCLLGMNFGDFPQIRRAPGFDLMAKQPLAGDRCVRDNDRYLFLEALLAARQNLIITFVGQSIGDGSARMPSSVVTELLEVLSNSFKNENLISRIVVNHPLQSFSSRYFETEGDERLFSFDVGNCESAQALQNARLAPPDEGQAPFVTKPLPAPEDEVLEISLGELIRFFKNPAAYFISNRLGINLGEQHTEIKDREPVDIDPLERFDIGSRLLKMPDNLDGYSLIRAEGILPPGVPGKFRFGEVSTQVEPIKEAIQGATNDSNSLPRVSLDIVVKPAGRLVRIVGSVANLWPQARIDGAFSKLTAANKLRLWINHLALCCVAQNNSIPANSILIGRGDDQADIFTLSRVDNPEELLTDLVEIYVIGLSQPLRYFSQTSWEYARAVFFDEPPDKAIISAKKKWLPSGPNGKFDAFAESLDTAAVLAFKGVANPLTDTAEPSFAQLALRILGPLFRHVDLINNGDNK